MTLKQKIVRILSFYLFVIQLTVALLNHSLSREIAL